MSVELTPVKDHVYVLAEPPGEPYYIGRVLEFVSKEDSHHTHSGGMEIHSHDHEDDHEILDKYWVRVNWLYRPSEISKKSADSRMLYLTMYSDLCPLQSLRGKCTIKHIEHVENIQKYRAIPNCFWFDKLYDRYITRLFDVIPTEKVVNLPKKIYDVLVDRYQYVITEIGKCKELCTAPNYCNSCNQWCSAEDSMTCFRCGSTYHMLCVDPPITKLPPRGFGWSCAACNGELERKLEESKGLQTSRATNKQPTKTTNAGATTLAPEEATATPSRVNSPSGVGGKGGSSNQSASASPPPGPPPMSRYKELEMVYESKVNLELTDEQHHFLSMWPFRYFGMHSHTEDLLDVDDYIYPRAASRVSSKHQAVVSDWPGRPVVYIEQEKPDKRGRKKMTNRKTTSTAIADTTPSEYDHFQSIPKKDRPPWVQVKPSGYIERGGEKTSTLMWKNPPDEENNSKKVEEFLKKTEPYAEKLKVDPSTPNFIDTCLKIFMDHDYDETAALNAVSSVNRKAIKEPTFSAEEKTRFEEGVRKFGSELHEVYKEVRTKKSADVVRYYYLWKKTPKGHEIWDNFRGRKSKKKPDKQNHVSHSGPIDEVADNSDDSAYDNDKAKNLKRTFVCKFCETTSSRAWRRAPGYPTAESDTPITALCIRCARLWRRYAVVWEDPEEVMRKITQKGSGGWKRKIEEELVEDSKSIFAERDRERERESTRKKMRLEKQQKEKGAQAAVAAIVASSKNSNNNGNKHEKQLDDDEEIQSTHDPTPVPASKSASNSFVQSSNQSLKSPGTTAASSNDEQTSAVKIILRRCAVCNQLDPVPEHLFCQSCGLNVHMKCYGAINAMPNGSWLCDCCSNDLKPLVNTLYSCALCPIKETHETAITVNTPGISDALKRTSDNNWAHIRCAVWSPWVNFADTTRLQPIEGISTIPRLDWRKKCTLCDTTAGACVKCGCCDDCFHIGCAGRSGYAFGFSIDPVKKEGGEIEEDKHNSDNIVTFKNQTGIMSAVILCFNENTDDLFSIYEVDPATGKTAFELYCEVYKKTPTSFTGAMRSATLYPLSRAISGYNKNDTDDGDITETPENHQATLVLSDSGRYVDEVILKSSVSCTRCNTKGADYWIERKEVGVTCPQCFWILTDSIKYEEAYSMNCENELSIGEREGSQQLKELGNYVLSSITSERLRDIHESPKNDPVTNSSSQLSTAPQSQPKENRAAVSNLLNPVPEPAITTTEGGDSNKDKNKNVRRAALDDILS